MTSEGQTQPDTHWTAIIYALLIVTDDAPAEVRIGRDIVDDHLTSLIDSDIEISE